MDVCNVSLTLFAPGKKTYIYTSTPLYFSWHKSSHTQQELCAYHRGKQSSHKLETDILNMSTQIPCASKSLISLCLGKYYFTVSVSSTCTARTCKISYTQLFLRTQGGISLLRGSQVKVTGVILYFSAVRSVIFWYMLFQCQIQSGTQHTTNTTVPDGPSVLLGGQKV